MLVTPARVILGRYPIEVQDRVARSMAKTAFGYDVDLVTPLCENREEQDYWRERRRYELLHTILPTGYSWLDEAEVEQSSKIGSYSIQLPYEDRKLNVYSYFRERNLKIDRTAFDYASNELAKLVRSQLHATSVDFAFSELPRGTNLGLPWMTSDKEYLPLVLERARTVAREGHHVKDLDPAILFWRGQPKGIGELPKQRTIWGMSKWTVVMGLRVQIPLLDYLKRQMDFAAWVGPAAVDEAVTTVHDSTDGDILSVDFSGFDASVPGALLMRVFSIMRHWFIGRDTPLIDLLERVFLETQLLTPEGTLGDRDGAVPSGDALTNLIDGLVQKFAFHYVAYRLRNSVAHHLVQGDDGVVAFQRPWALEDVVESMSELGLSVSSDKSEVSRHLVGFLQNLHHTDYRREGQMVGIRPLSRVLNGALSYERFKGKEWNGFDDTLRWYQQFESAKWHPQFSKAVNLLYMWDKYSQEYNVDQILSRGGGLDTAKSLLNEKSFPYGKFSISGLHQFQTVRVMEEIRKQRLQSTASE